MVELSVIIPNYNGEQYIEACLDSLKEQCCGSYEVIVVDNASQDASAELVRTRYPWVRLKELDQNYGFSRAVNEGIRMSKGEFVILLNNDTRADGHFAEELLAAVRRDARIFSCQAQMRQMDRPELLDSAGDLYCALGWAVSRGKNAPVCTYAQEGEIFSACAGAAIYRKSMFEQIGYFDEAHFAYLEDVDIGYRAKICGFRNCYAPRAVVWHKGSASSGSRYNHFKTRLAARNNLYLLYKNMPRWQILINLPFLLLGIAVKFFFFTLKGMGLTYLKGLWQGVLLARKGEKTPFLAENFDHCWAVQAELWRNLGYIFCRIM